MTVGRDGGVRFPDRSSTALASFCFVSLSFSLFWGSGTGIETEGIDSLFVSSDVLSLPRLSLECRRRESGLAGLSIICTSVAQIIDREVVFFFRSGFDSWSSLSLSESDHHKFSSRVILFPCKFTYDRKSYDAISPSFSFVARIYSRISTRQARAGPLLPTVLQLLFLAGIFRAGLDRVLCFLDRDQLIMSLLQGFFVFPCRFTYDRKSAIRYRNPLVRV